MHLIEQQQVRKRGARTLALSLSISFGLLACLRACARFVQREEVIISAAILKALCVASFPMEK